MSPFDRFILDASWAVPASSTSPNAAENITVPHESGNSVFDILQDTEFSGLWSMQSPALLNGQGVPIGQQSSPTTDSQFGSPSYAESHRTSLDRRCDKSSVFIGYSNESDPFLLEHFPYKADDEVDFFMVTYRKPSAAPVSQGNPPCHILQSKRQATSQGRDVISKAMAMADERQALDELVDLEAGVSLLRLYARPLTTLSHSHYPIIFTNSRLDIYDSSFIHCLSFLGQSYIAMKYTSSKRRRLDY